MNRNAATWVAAASVAAVCALLIAFGASHRSRVDEPTTTVRTETDERQSSIASPASAQAAAPSAPSPGFQPPVAPPSPSTRWADENALMQYLRPIEDADPTVALAVAREGDQLFPGGDAAAERAMIEVKSLAREGHLSEARGAAEQMVHTYPGTRWALEVERHTGAHPRLNH